MKTFARGVRLVFVMEYSVRSALRRILLLASGLSIAALAQDQTAPAEREAHWRQDLQFFAAGLGASGHSVDFHSGISTRGQIDFAKLYPKGRFDAAIEALEADIPRVSDAEMVLGLMRLVASANVAHNSVVMPLSMGFFARLPLTFHWFPDGLAVIGASPEYSAALGTRVLRIGSMTPEQLLPAIAPYIAHENEVWLREQAVGFLRPQAVLQHFGLLDQDGRVALSLEKPGEPPFTLSVTPGDPRVTRIPMAEGLHTPVPLFRSQPGKDYWHWYLADSQTLFIQYNACRNDPKLPFSEFARQVLSEAGAHPPKRVVIDLRQNGGGDSRVIGPLKSGLASRLKAIGPVYVLIGPSTFSSALMNAIELRRALHATLVGEAAGEKPNSYGEVKLLTLPNSKVVVRYTTKYFALAKSGDPAALEPDLAAPHTLADALAGRDPALEAAIAAGK